MPNEIDRQDVGVAVGVCVVCSVFVSTAAVVPEADPGPQQDARQEDEHPRGRRPARGRAKRRDVDELFERDRDPRGRPRHGRVRRRRRPGRPSTSARRPKIPNASMRSVARDDMAGIKQTAKYQLVYFDREGDRIERVILPVYGKGLWSTMYGFLALDARPEHDQELRLLRARRDARAGRRGRQPDGGRSRGSASRPSTTTGKPADRGRQGHGRPESPTPHQVDGSPGATLTARGVENSSSSGSARRATARSSRSCKRRR